MHQVFVYGTLKRGFANHDATLLAGALLGVARTVVARPLVVAGRWFSPVLLDEPGNGECVEGELYRVNDAVLAALDRIEGVGGRGGYRRITLDVVDAHGVPYRAFGYVKDRADVAIIHDGPYAAYHDQRYVPRARRAPTTESTMTAPTARDVKVFVPSRDFALSLRFYSRLGWQCNWQHEDSLAEIELAGVRLYLQNYYAREWAENFMIYVPVDDAAAWHAHLLGVLADGEFPGARVEPPRREDYGARVTYAWDPCGVLIHFAEPVGD